MLMYDCACKVFPKRAFFAKLYPARRGVRVAEGARLESV